jgi:hypothetical protein
VKTYKSEAEMPDALRLCRDSATLFASVHPSRNVLASRDTSLTTVKDMES